MKTIKKDRVTATRLFVMNLIIAITLEGCSTYPSWLPSSGPSGEQVVKSSHSGRVKGIRVLDINDEITRRLFAMQRKSLFSESFLCRTASSYVIGAGDVIEVSIWEAPPAVLFTGNHIDPRVGATTTQVTTFPEQMVGSNGKINIPFAGQITSAGRTPQQIEATIAKRLKKKANQPQVLVRVIQNNTANVTVVGEVTTSTRVPLTARRERLLDALAAAGGVRQPVNKTTLQVTRGTQVQALPLDTIIRDPKQNIVLEPGDVLTAMYQPLSFTVLGAMGKNEEINFETQGILLSQALARAGGLQAGRADASAVFIFRFEHNSVFNAKGTKKSTHAGLVPVVYRLNLKDPGSFFLAQRFPVVNKDILYVSNAPGEDLQRFLNIIGSAFYPALNAGIIAAGIVIRA